MASLAATILMATVVGAATVGFAQPGYINFTSVGGYFLQDDLATNASTFNYTQNNFGLKNASYPVVGAAFNLTQWQQFALQVEALNAESPQDTVYKVLFLGRHGQGYHNAAESFYSTPNWNCYWAQLSGNGTSTWQDADLTADGVLQAQIAHNFWKQSYAVQKVPYLQSYYTSPLLRCLRTANITFSGLATPPYYPFVPTVKEFFREGISLHTCDKRGSKSSIHKLFPQYQFEEGFNEQDELWNGVTAETSSAQQLRSLKALNDVFMNDDHTWISVTSHSGEIASLLSVLGHRPFSLATGAIIPVLVKAKFLPAAAASPTTVAQFTTSTWCHNGPPITSNASNPQGCVCQATTTPLPSLSTVAGFFPGQTAPINEFTTTTTIGRPSSTTACSTLSKLTATSRGHDWPLPWARPTGKPWSYAGGWK